MAATEDVVQGALRKRSTMFTTVEPGLLSQLCAVAEQHGLAAQQLAAALDKFMTVQRQGHTSLQPEDVDAFSSDLARSNRKPQTLAAARTDNLFNRVSLDDMAETALLAEEPTTTGGQPSQRITPYLAKSATRPASVTRQHTPASTGRFKGREQSGGMQAVLNSHIAAPERVAGGEAMEVDGSSSACEVEVVGASLSPGTRYMVDRLEDKVAYLEGRILALSEEVEAAAGGGDEGAVHPVAVAAQEAAMFVGRVCCDSEEGRFNPQSVLLEGSMRHSQGARVRLDLSQCPAYRLFPGQVVSVRGSNPSGHCLVAGEVLGGAPLPMPRSSLQALAARAAGGGQQGRSLVLAAGPFTTSDDLEYEPLAALLAYCCEAAPDVLLLVGPFVDAEHPAIKGGLLEESFEEVYQSRVLSQLEQFCSSPGVRTRVVLLPSTKDVHHHPVFPQPPLEEGPQQPRQQQQQQGGEGLVLLGNPATFRCDEVVVGCSAADWLMACTNQEVSRAAAGQGDRLAALAGHVLAQRSYFPLFPPPATLPLDSSKGAALELPCTPDLLVLPSELAPFAKILPVVRPCLAPGGGAPTPEGNVVCINPGRLTKGASGGTFAHVYVAALQDALDVAAGAPPSTNAPVPHKVDERCRVEIRRI